MNSRLWLVSCVAGVALVLSGCGGGGSPETAGNGSGSMNGGTSGGGDATPLSILENWQRFENGSPTLSMTGEEIEEAWMGAIERSTHVAWVDESVTVDEIDVDLPTDLVLKSAPVMEHNGIPIAEIRARYTFKFDGGDATWLSDDLAYAGWLDHTEFRVSFDRECEVGAAGCSGNSPDFMNANTFSSVRGRYSESTPTGVGSAVWKGVMVGMEYVHIYDREYDGPYAASDLLSPGGHPDAYFGDAQIMIDDLAAPEVDVAFTNIHNVTDGTRHDDMRWDDLRVEDGLFGSGSWDEDNIVGMFNGPEHQEVGGRFERGGIAGAFGAKRQ